MGSLAKYGDKANKYTIRAFSRLQGEMDAFKREVGIGLASVLRGE
jgi:hypothetical protein